MGASSSHAGNLPIDEVIRSFEEEFRKAQERLGKFNLAIFGKTGVGKSTLINAIFSENIAATGNGRPVTVGIEYYEHPSGFFGVYDSEGIEVGQEGDAILERFAAIIAESRGQPISDQIHVIWYCVRWSDRRFEDKQADFIRALAAENIPVLFVLTQVPRNEAGELHPDAIELAEDVVRRELPLAPSNRVFFTMALADPFMGHETHGLQELLDATFRVAPEGVRSAIIAAQKIDLDRKIAEARTFIKPAAGVAAGIGATPIPFADAVLLVPVQIGLMAKIAAIFGLSLDSQALAKLAGASLTAGGATAAGKYIATSVLKLIPGGNVAAGVIRAGVASSLTYAVGEAWIKACIYLYDLGPDAAARVPVDELRRIFLEELKTRIKRSPAPEELS